MRRRTLAVLVLAGAQAAVACVAAHDESASESASMTHADPTRVDAMFREPGHCEPVIAPRGTWVPKPLFAGALEDRACAFVWSGSGVAARALLEEAITKAGGIAHDNPTGNAPSTPYAFPAFGGIDGGLTPTHGCDVCVEDDGAITWLNGEEVYGFIPRQVDVALLNVPRSDGTSVELVVYPQAQGPFVLELPPATPGLSWVEGPVRLRD
jgi:hypothetical protein